LLFHLRSLSEAVGLTDKLKDMPFACEPIQKGCEHNFISGYTATAADVTDERKRASGQVRKPASNPVRKVLLEATESVAEHHFLLRIAYTALLVTIHTGSLSRKRDS
jgi:hypothetical protein